MKSCGYFCRSIGLFDNYKLKSQFIKDYPLSYAHAIWFYDSRSSQFTRCDRCPSENRKCTTCQRRYDGEIFLIYDVTNPDMMAEIRKLDRVPVADFSEALNVSEIEAPFEIFNVKRRLYLENKYKVHIYLCKETDDEREYVVKSHKVKFEKIITLILKKSLPETLNGIIDEFDVIQNPKLLPQLHRCTKTKNCKYETWKKYNFDRHVSTCGISNVKKILCKQTEYGKETSVLDEMVRKGYIPADASKYRNNFIVSFDIETYETKITGCAPETGLVTEANLALLSIAIGCNSPGYQPKCWVRKSSCPTEETRLIQNFVKELNRIWELKQQTLPFWVGQAQDKIMDEKYRLKRLNAKWFQYLNIFKFQRAMEKFTALDVFGFNSGKFDLPVIIAPLLIELKKDTSRINVLKKMSSYFSISTSKFIFKDALRFTAPCSYDKFARVWEAPTSKSIWPYSLYSSVEEIKAAKTFPLLSDFESKLKGGSKPDMAIYISAKTEFYRRKLLPRGHPDRICSMYGFLRFYNIQDVQPLAMAIENCFSCYDQYFGINAITAMSLPSLASTAMFNNFDKKSPLIFSFSDANKEINELFRANVFGGLVNTFRRHVATYDTPVPIPRAARYADNGDPFTSIISLDFTSMYLTCQKKEMPTSPGILWTLTGAKLTKNIMCPNHSFKAQQWLSYKQAADPFLENADGSRSIIETKYHRGEKYLYNSRTRTDSWPVDGYALTSHGAKVYEFHGDRWHLGCPHCQPNVRNFKWLAKKEDILRHGYELEVIWECQFDKLLPEIKDIETNIPDILQKFQCEKELLAGVRSGKFFGFLVCNVSSPPAVIEEMKDFPPVIKRVNITTEYLTNYMKKQIKHEKPNAAKFERETLVQCFNAENHLLMTNLAQFYMAKGLKISNVTKFIQFIPNKSLLPFVEHVTSMRIDAEENNLPTKGNTAKIFGNSGYGKVSYF